LENPAVDKFAMKLPNGELLALGAYQVSGRKAYVYILYTAPDRPSTSTAVWRFKTDPAQKIISPRGSATHWQSREVRPSFAS